MTRFSAIDLARLPVPAVVETISFEQVLADLKSDFLARQPGFADTIDLESDPINTLMQAYAARETRIRARINAAGKAVMLPFAQAGDLDNLAAFYGVTRLTLVEAQPDAQPPIAAVYEDDTAFRRRVVLALEGQSTAGPAGSYLFWALSADASVRDASVHSPTPGEVVVTVLSHDGDGTASAELLDEVDATLNDEWVRPLTDHVTVQSATIVPYDIIGSITYYPGPNATVTRSAAEAALAEYIASVSRLGHDVTRSGIFAALHQPGVQSVSLTSPAADIEIDDTQASYCTGITLTDAGTDI